MSFTEFCEIVQSGIANGEIKITSEINNLDLAIQYAIGQEMQERGTNIFTAEEIYFLIGKHCGKDVQNSLFENRD